MGKRLLRTFRVYNTNIDGFMEEMELEQIARWAETVQSNGIIVEVGSFKGRSSYAWAASCKSDVSVFCLDRFGDNFYPDFQENMKEFTNVTAIKCDVPYRMNSWVNQPIDIFFLDGMHMNPHDIDAIEYFLPLIKKGGILCGHDYYPIEKHMPDVTTNVKILENKLNQKVQTFEGTSLWAFDI
jgi:predicted O-methyltransferase YrrM